MAALPQFLKRYYFPIVTFSLGLFFQLFVLPRSYPPSHYDVLGIEQFAPIEDVAAAYDRLSSKWFSGLETPATTEFVKIRYAFELLSNPLWKRDYDLFNIDDQLHVTELLTEQYAELKFSNIPLPLLNASSSGLTNQAFNVLTSENFISIMSETKTILIQVYSDGSARCAKFISSWKSIAILLDGVADTGMVELGDVQLTSYLAEKKPTKQPFFRNGLPSLVAYPPDCKSSKCYVRYQGDLSVDPVVDWMATSVLGLPRILYYTKETLVPNFIAKSGQHKVKVIFFSKTGERATPFLRQAAKDYWAYASFAMVLWREEDSSIWWNLFHVESAPAFVFLKDSGVDPVVYHGMLLTLKC
ncbi:uncharacterized protein M6B38_331755 [Iris pallida]|uniref:J domain-containing protein n=1 Tax=Iris pallida TaxID=29817 RepID=A0AAX6H490_IRIPA|nr:uncharacterized protein M6B38_331755 [Iris pallida]